MNNFSLFHGAPLFNHANPVLSSVFQCLKGEEMTQSNPKQMDKLREKGGKTEHGAPKKEGPLGEGGGGDRGCRRVARRLDERERGGSCELYLEALVGEQRL